MEGIAEGNGRLYERKTGRLIFDGHFEYNRYSGYGTYYKLLDHEDGSISNEIRYQGYFLNNQYNGFGIQYDYKNGHYYVCYIGGFKENEYSGYGYCFTYEPGYYDGPGWESAFQDEDNRKFLITAKLQVRHIIMDVEDKKHVMLRYKGMFRNNKYNGEGTLYNISEEGKYYVEHEGHFVDNEYDQQ